MKYARKHDLIASNPMDNVERPKSQRYVGAFYSVSELETLFQAVKGDPCEFPVLMACEEVRSWDSGGGRSTLRAI